MSKIKELESRLSKVEYMLQLKSGIERDEEVFKELCAIHKTNSAHMQSRSRKQVHVQKRVQIAKALRSRSWSFGRIARQFKKCHQSILHYIKLDKKNENA